MELPPQPPKTRDFKGSTMAPFGGNNMLVLYSCPAAPSPKYFVQVLHNEHPIAVPVSFHLINKRRPIFSSIKTKLVSFLTSPYKFIRFCQQGCDGKDFCPLEDFKVLCIIPSEFSYKYLHFFPLDYTCMTLFCSCRPKW